jgi:hypothetical protein
MEMSKSKRQQLRERQRRETLIAFPWSSLDMSV